MSNPTGTKVPAPTGGNTGGNPQTNPGANPGRSSTPAGNPGPVQAGPDFDTWKDWTDPTAASEPNAEKAITAINAALPSLAGQDRARANYYLGMAQLITGRQTAACTSLTRARSEANNALKTLIDPYFTMEGAPCK
jgi:hypothetical protein